MTEEEKKVPWLDTPDPQRFINNAAKFSDLMMMYPRSTNQAGSS